MLVREKENEKTTNHTVGNGESGPKKWGPEQIEKSIPGGLTY